jgi:hypothetical protein
VLLQFRLSHAPQQVVAEDQFAGVSQAGFATKGAPSANDAHFKPSCAQIEEVAPSTAGAGL